MSTTYPEHLIKAWKAEVTPEKEVLEDAIRRLDEKLEYELKILEV